MARRSRRLWPAPLALAGAVACTGVLIDEKPDRGAGEVGEPGGRDVERADCRDGTNAEDVCRAFGACSDHGAEGACLAALSGAASDDALRGCAQCWARGECRALLGGACDGDCIEPAWADTLRATASPHAGGRAPPDAGGPAPDAGLAERRLCERGQVPDEVGAAADRICARLRECLGGQISLRGCADEIAARVAYDGVAASGVLACATCHQAFDCGAIASGSCVEVCAEGDVEARD